MTVGHRAVPVSCPFWPPDGAAALHSVSSERRVPSRKEGDKQKGFLFLLSLPKQEETLRLPANVLGLNLTSCPSLDSQKGSESDMICLGSENGHIIAQSK